MGDRIPSFMHLIYREYFSLPEGLILHLLGEVPGAVDAVLVGPALEGLLPVQEEKLQSDVG